MADENNKLVVREHVVLKKFEGDDQTQEPVEVIEIVVENGVEVSRKVYKKGEDNAIN